MDVIISPGIKDLVGLKVFVDRSYFEISPYEWHYWDFYGVFTRLSACELSQNIDKNNIGFLYEGIFICIYENIYICIFGSGEVNRKVVMIRSVRISLLRDDVGATCGD